MMIGLLSSCASMISGRTATIKVTSAPQGATCQFKNSESSGTLTTVNVIHVQKSESDLKIDCNKLDFGTGTYKTHPGANFWVLANVLNFGVGFIYDLYTGAAWTYPEQIDVPLVPTSATYHGNFMLKPGTSGAVNTPILTNEGLGNYPVGYDGRVTPTQVEGQQYPTPYAYPANGAAQQPAAQPAIVTPTTPAQQQWIPAYSQAPAQSTAAAATAPAPYKPAPVMPNYPAYPGAPYPGSAAAQQPAAQLQPNQSVNPPGVPATPAYDQMLPPNMRGQ